MLTWWWQSICPWKSQVCMPFLGVDIPKTQHYQSKSPATGPSQYPTHRETRQQHTSQVWGSSSQFAVAWSPCGSESASNMKPEVVAWKSTSNPSNPGPGWDKKRHGAASHFKGRPLLLKNSRNNNFWFPLKVRGGHPEAPRDCSSLWVTYCLG